MKWQHTARSEKDYVRAPARIQKAFDKQIDLIVGNLLHPSLHAKKYDESAGLWQARVNRDWRFYFIIDGGTLVVVRIVPHPK